MRLCPEPLTDRLSFSLDHCVLSTAPWKARAEVVVDRPLETVWKAWSRLDRLTAWYAPSAAGDLHQGSQLILQWADLDVAVKLDVETVRAPHEFALAANLGTYRQQQSVRLEGHGQKTHVEVIHQGGVDHFLKSGTEAGWRTQLKMLRLYLETYAGEARAYVAEKYAIEAPPDSGFAYLVSPQLLASWLGEPSAPITTRGQTLELKIGSLRYHTVVLNLEEPHEIALHFPLQQAVLRCRQIPLDRRDAGVKMLVIELSCWGNNDHRSKALLEAIGGASARLANRIGVRLGCA